LDRYLRKDNEDTIEYLLRLVQIKLEEYPKDLDWSDIVIYCGFNCHYDSLRKAMQPEEYGAYAIYKYCVDKFANSNGNNDEMLKQLEIVRDEIKKERYKLQATKLEKDRDDRHLSKFELFYDNIKDAITRLEPPIFNLNHTYYNDDKEWVLGMGDFHYGATFDSQNNQYSREICKQRLEKLLFVLQEEIDRNEINKIKVVNVSDTIQGILRLTDLQINDIPIVECVVEISRLLAEFLNQLSAYCEIEYYHVSTANHSQIRPLGSKASEIATEDMEKIIVNYISDLLANNNRVQVISDLDKEYITFNIFDFKTIVMHGHQLKSVPNTIRDLSNLHRTFYDYAFLGHRHSANEIIVGEGKHHNIEILTCPSFVGSDPYADKLMVGSKAMCKLYEFDSVHGHIGSKNIILN